LGERDGLLSRDDEEALAAAIPGSQLIVYDDTGHLVFGNSQSGWPTT
jgi:hypothetical protein